MAREEWPSDASHHNPSNLPSSFVWPSNEEEVAIEMLQLHGAYIRHVSAHESDNGFTYVYLRHWSGTGDDLRGLEKISSLEHLSVEGLDVDDRMIDSLVRLRDLRTLMITNARISLEGKCRLKEALPETELIDLHESLRILEFAPADCGE